MQALCRRAGRESWLPGFIKIAAIGTLADVVPLVGENRVIAKLGLDLLTRGPHKVGPARAARRRGPDRQDHRQLSHLVHAGAARERRRPHEHARHRDAAAAGQRRGAWRDEARALALQLDGENVRRQEEEAEILAAAKKIVQTDPDVGARSVLVVAGEGWHRGVIGIVASKLVDAFHRPAIVLSVEDGVAHGSCRSIPRFDMLGALERCAHLLVRFGGHRQAAGLTMEAARIREFRARRQRRRRRDARARGSDAAAADRRRPRRFAASPAAWPPASPSLAPFGAGNPRPVFAARGVEIVDGPRKLKERHLKMALKQDGRIFRAVAWRAAERHDYLTEHKAALDVAFSLEQNQYNGETYVELTLADIRSSEA